jgi:hypothetical protein
VNLYSINVNIVGTAYIKAESEAQALAIANRDLRDTGFELSDGYQPIADNICIDGCQFDGLLDNEEEIAFSPAFSINADQNEFTANDVSFEEDLTGE